MYSGELDNKRLLNLTSGPAKLSSALSINKDVKVIFNDDHTLYFGGDKKDKTAFIEIKLFGTAERKYKEAIISKICSLFEEEVSITKDSIYIILDDLNDWAWNGNMFLFANKR